MHSSSTIEHACFLRRVFIIVFTRVQAQMYLDDGTILSYFVGKSTHVALILCLCSTGLRPKPALACLCRLVAAAIIFLLTATRDEQLFRALAEAAQNVVDKKGWVHLCNGTSVYSGGYF